jgi:hypothetical protein
MWYGKNDKEEEKPVEKKKQEEKSQTQRYLNKDYDITVTQADNDDVRLKKDYD